MNKIIVVFCHSRSKLLENCLKSIKDADAAAEWITVVVHQQGHYDVQEVINKNLSNIDYLITFPPKYEKAICNINANRIMGTKFAFKALQASYVLGLEEDTQISKDALFFIDSIYKKYHRHKSFRGINLGSMEYGENAKNNGFSLLRYGAHGQAGVLTRSSWKKIEKKKLLNFDLNDFEKAWDAEIEFYLKSGFMVTPNLSRSLDKGVGGTFSPKNSNDRYFIEMEKSWVSFNYQANSNYVLNQINHSWRYDAIRYRRLLSIFFMVRGSKLFRLINSQLKVSKFLVKLFPKKNIFYNKL